MYILYSVISIVGIGLIMLVGSMVRMTRRVKQKVRANKNVPEVNEIILDKNSYVIVREEFLK